MLVHRMCCMGGRVAPARAPCRPHHTSAAVHVRSKPLSKRHVLVVAEAAAEAAGPGPGSFAPDSQQQLLWDSVTRSLLRLGKAGASESHTRSLSALLKDHTLVKVKVNGISDEGAIAAIGQQLAEGAGAALLQVKGSTLLYADGSLPLEQLVQVAEANNSKSAAWRAKRQEDQQERRTVREAVQAKKSTSAARKQRRVAAALGQVAATAPKKGGPLTRGDLAQDWQQLATNLAAQVEEEAAQEAAAGGGAKKAGGSSGSSSSSSSGSSSSSRPYGAGSTRGGAAEGGARRGGRAGQE